VERVGERSPAGTAEVGPREPLARGVRQLGRQRGNQWNVPIGLPVAKTTRIGGLPVKFQLGVEYSAVRQDLFGQRAQLKLNVIPVIPGLIRRPLLGGG
jgi:hypothetical protein